MGMKSAEIIDALGISRQAFEQYRDRVQDWSGKQVGKMANNRSRTYDREDVQLLASYEGRHQARLQELLASFEPPVVEVTVDEPGQLAVRKGTNLIKSSSLELTNWDELMPDDEVDDAQIELIGEIVETDETTKDSIDNVLDAMAIKAGKQRARRLYTLQKQALANEMARLEKEDLLRGKERLEDSSSS